MSHEAKAAGRKVTGMHNRADRAVRYTGILTLKRGQRGTGDQVTMPMNTGARWQKLDTVLMAVNRPTEGQPYPASRADKPPDLGAGCWETGSSSSEEGRAQRCADLFHIIAPSLGSDAARPNGLFDQGRLRMLRLLQRIVDAEGPRTHR